MSIRERTRAAMVRPTFQAEAAQTGRSRDDIAAVRTYRYLRLGMVVVTIALVAAVWRQRTESGCYQGSISAYFYTPARPVFVEQGPAPDPARGHGAVMGSVSSRSGPNISWSRRSEA